MIRPDQGKYPITQAFGANKNQLGYGAAGHTGVDLGTPLNTPLVAGFTGKVIAVGETNTFGKYVKIAANGFTVYTGHMNRIDVVLGQSVNQGQVIGLSGNTGYIPGTNQRVAKHAHWEVTFNGKLVDPLTVIEGDDEMYREMAEDRLNTINNYKEENKKLIQLAEERLTAIETLKKEKEGAVAIAEDRLKSILIMQKEVAEGKDLDAIIKKFEEIIEKAKAQKGA